MSKVTLNVNGFEVDGNTGESLLKQLENAGLQPEYQCRNGVCGACRCRLATGKVSQKDSLAYTGKDEILTCQSRPLTDVTLEFDYTVSVQMDKASNG
ncbi:2Fe-2S iron-sulfur cluster-binding protein [Parasalinivibrio latis]|uniref:2Fe-2S iron-sulfur cluster-binding protein n=1 Tax=Parasalinivibrio latis TaxID=2952610 RepID=UPI0030E574BC